jgi:hypothetical protein
MATERPTIQYDCEYSKYERLVLAQGHYHADLLLHMRDPIEVQKPVIAQISKLYGVPPTTLGRHIRKPGQKTLDQLHSEQQVFTVIKEEVLVERLLVLDDFNIPADKQVLYGLAHNLLHRRDPDCTLG